MANQLVFALAFLVAITLWTIISQVLRIHRTKRQREIARRGVCCQGKVVAIQRPFMLDCYTRLYFNFEPPGTQCSVMACHLYGDVSEEQAPWLPATGSIVTVRYLPEQPQQAVIGKLVPPLGGVA